MAVVGVAEDSNVVGAPLPSQTAEYKPMLKGFGEDKVVTVFNPLTSDFRFQHARSVVQAAPLTDEQRRVEDKLGTPISKDGNPQAHYSQYWILKAGESKNLPGDIAQKAVQDLVTYILMAGAGKGQPKNVSDGFARGEVEKTIVMAIHDNVSFFNSVTPEEYSNHQVEKLNNQVTETPDPAPGQGVHYDPSGTSPKTTQKA